MKYATIGISFLFLITMASPIPCDAYNVLYTDETGSPVKWDKSKPIQYYLDPGPYGGYTNEQAHALLKEAMKLWEDAPTANVPKFEFAGYLPEDVNRDNYQKYVDLNTCLTGNLEYCDNLEVHQGLKTVIVFDDDHYILDNELCRIIECGAKAGPITFEGSYADGVKYIVQGQAIFGRSGYGADGTVGLFAHELGHLLGLTHTSLNQQLLISPVDDFDFPLFIPAMQISTKHSLSISGSESATLNPDDMAGISVLYPSDNYFAETVSIKGSIKKADATSMPEVNVVARNIEDPLCKAYSFISGHFCPHPLIAMTWICLDPDGNYEISGLPPGSYTVEVEEITEDPDATGIFDAYLAGDAEFWNEGDQAAEDPYLYTVITLAAGETRENIDIILNRSEVTEDRVKFIPLDVILGYFPMPAVTACTDTTVDYAALIGIDEGNNDDAPSTGGCSLIVRNKVNRRH